VFTGSVLSRVDQSIPILCLISVYGVGKGRLLVEDGHSYAEGLEGGEVMVVEREEALLQLADLQQRRLFRFAHPIRPHHHLPRVRYALHHYVLTARPAHPALPAEGHGVRGVAGRGGEATGLLGAQEEEVGGVVSGAGLFECYSAQHGYELILA